MAIKEIKKNIPVKNDLVKELDKDDLEKVNGGVTIRLVAGEVDQNGEVLGQTFSRVPHNQDN